MLNNQQHSLLISDECRWISIFTQLYNEEDVVIKLNSIVLICFPVSRDELWVVSINERAMGISMIFDIWLQNVIRILGAWFEFWINQHGNEHVVILWNNKK